MENLKMSVLNRTMVETLYSRVSSVIIDLGSLKPLFFIFIILHFTIGIFIPPLFTSDFERNLFYGKAFWKFGFNVYDMTPLDIDPDYNIGDPTSGILSYPNTTYDYPTLQLLFWAGLASLPFSDILVKFTLSSIDIINFFMLYSLLGIQSREVKKGNEKYMIEKIFTLSYLLFSIPFSAIEGQSTAITIFFLLIPLILHKQKAFLGYIFIGLGFHWKYVSLLVLPYLIISDRKVLSQMVLGILSLAVTIITLSFPLLFSNFVLRYFGFLGNLGEYSGQLTSNPLLIDHLCISSLLSSGVLILAALYWLGFLPQRNIKGIYMEGILNRAYYIPFLLLLGFLKIYKTAFPWYWMWFYACLAIFPLKERRLFTGLLAVTFAIGIVDFIDITVGIENIFDYFP